MDSSNSLPGAVYKSCYRAPTNEAIEIHLIPNEMPEQGKMSVKPEQSNRANDHKSSLHLFSARVLPS